MKDEQLQANESVAAGAKTTRRRHDTVELPLKYEKLLREKYPLDSTQKSRLAELLIALEDTPPNSKAADRVLNELLDSALFLAVARNFPDFCQRFLNWSEDKAREFAARPSDTVYSGTIDEAPAGDRDPTDSVEEFPTAAIHAVPGEKREAEAVDVPPLRQSPRRTFVQRAGIDKPSGRVRPEPRADRMLADGAETPSKDMAHEIGDGQKRSRANVKHASNGDAGQNDTSDDHADGEPVPSGTDADLKIESKPARQKKATPSSGRAESVLVTAPENDQPEPLTAAEAHQLKECEDIIEQGLRKFLEVGLALLTVSDGQLYRRTYARFEDYCRERWGLDRRRPYQLIEAAKVVENVKIFHIQSQRITCHATRLRHGHW